MVFPIELDRQPSGVLASLTGWMAYGHFGVTVFIVLAGYSLTIAVSRRDGDLTGGFWAFLRRRIRRIVPPYWAALGMSALLLLIFLNHKTGTHWDLSVPLTWQGFASNFLLVQDITDERRQLRLLVRRDRGAHLPPLPPHNSRLAQFELRFRGRFRSPSRPDRRRSRTCHPVLRGPVPGVLRGIHDRCRIVRSRSLQAEVGSSPAERPDCLRRARLFRCRPRYASLLLGKSPLHGTRSWTRLDLGSSPPRPDARPDPTVSANPRIHPPGVHRSIFLQHLFGSRSITASGMAHRRRPRAE